jgi:hypothetical protein
MSDIHYAIPDLYHSLREKYIAEDVDFNQVIEQFMEECGAALYNHYKEERDARKIRISSIGQCERMQWYKAHDFEEEEPADKLWITFLQGHLMEALVKAVLKISGHKVKDEQAKLSVAGVQGSCDAVVDNELVDFKTASNWSFDKFKDDEIKNDSFGYLEQISAYAHALGKKRAHFIVLNKNTGELKLTTVNTLKNIEDHVIYVKDIVSKKNPPDRPVWAVSAAGELDMRCSFCSFKQDCYESLQERKVGKITKHYVVDEDAGNF